MVPASYQTEDKKVTAPPSEPVKEVGSIADLSGIMVRLAAYSNLNYFDKEAVKDLGIITYIPKGEFTIVLLRGYETEADAAIALRKVQAKGFKEAYLVLVKDGVMEKR